MKPLRDDRARGRNDGSIYLILSLLGDPGTAIGLGALALPAGPTRAKPSSAPWRPRAAIQPPAATHASRPGCRTGAEITVVVDAVPPGKGGPFSLKATFQ